MEIQLEIVLIERNPPSVDLLGFVWTSTETEMRKPVWQENNVTTDPLGIAIFRLWSGLRYTFRQGRHH